MTEPRLVAFGYRQNEDFSLPALCTDHFLSKTGPVYMDPSFVITRYRDNFDRPAVLASLGVNVVGAAMPHVCLGDTATSVTGAMFRFCRHIDGSRRDRRGFRRFVWEWLNNGTLVPLPSDSDVCPLTWLNGTPYSLARRTELWQKFVESGLGYGLDVPDVYLKVKSFIKDECYPEYKMARGINSRHDVFKVLVGPIYQLINNALFNTKWFIKKVPVRDRPEFIMRLFRNGNQYFTSDYSSFEAHFTKELMEDAELLLVKFMVSKVPYGTWFMNLIRRAKCGLNTINYKNWSCKLEGKRMSGEMDTSLSNSFANLMFMLYLCDQSGITDVDGVIEGDDGLFVFTGDVKKIDSSVFKDFGLSIKILLFDELNHASFCGMVFSPSDMTNVTNPIEEIVSFGWTNRRYAYSKSGVHKCLIRAKALSLAYQYPRCPILTKLAYKMCQLTAGFDSLSFIQSQGSHYTNLYEIELILKAHEYFEKNELNGEPGMQTRLLVESLYSVTVSDQLCIENYIDNMTSLSEINCSSLITYISPVWVDYFNRYAMVVNRNSPVCAAGLTFPSVRKAADVSFFMVDHPT